MTQDDIPDGSTYKRSTGSNTGDQTSVSGSSGSCTGNAGTATKLAAAKNINGVAFDGSADITVYDATKASYYRTPYTSNATPTPTGDRIRNDLEITALAVDAQLQDPSGTPVAGGELTVIITSTGAHALTYTTGYAAPFTGIAFPTVSINGTVIFKCKYYGAKWNLIAAAGY